jgi:hypothetical protein
MGGGYQPSDVIHQQKPTSRPRGSCRETTTDTNPVPTTQVRTSPVAEARIVWRGSRVADNLRSPACSAGSRSLHTPLHLRRGVLLATRRR